MTGQGSWPHLPTECPRCRYCEQFTPPLVDDSGYEIVGFCRHPRIAMELFARRDSAMAESEHCSLFIESGRS
ncbi:MAG TPA: hypothetical protein VMU39_19725 [Solirubrobacteraceae bacterium]|nr:hypothetical protein [Solirubrobacteraceae bacterium]